MTDHDNSHGEPTMEEILASIRRIISEDNDESEGASRQAKPEVSAGEPNSAPKESTEQTGRQAAEVLELSPAQMVQEEKSARAADAKPNGHDTAASAPQDTPGPGPAASAAGREDNLGLKVAESDKLGSAMDRTPEAGPANEVEETLLSPEVATAAAAAFGALSKDVTVSRSGGEIRSLEELVKEMMKPMLKEWLDENLPPLVEDVVEREVRRLSHRRVRR